MSSAINLTMENALKQAISAAVKKLEFKKYDVPEDNVVDCFLTDLFGILFPNNSGLVKERKKSGAPVLDEPVDAGLSSAGPAAAGAGEPVVKKERKKPGPKPKVDADGNPVEKKVKERKPKKEEAPQKAGDVVVAPNIEWSPTWTKKIKSVVKELGIELRLTPAKQKEFAAHLNAMAKSDYDAKTFEEHMRAHLRPTAVPPVRPGGAAAAGDDSDGEEVELTEVEFKGTTYSIDTRDRKSMAVYDEAGDRHLGYVGSGEFVGMNVPVDGAESEDDE